MPPLNVNLPTNKVIDDLGHTDDHNATNVAVNLIAAAVDDDVAVLAAHEADTTGVHGIADTASLETATGAAAKVAAHVAATDPHGDRAFASTLASALEARVDDLEAAPAGGGGTQVAVDGVDVAELDIDSDVITIGDFGVRVLYATNPPPGLAVVAPGGSGLVAKLQAMAAWINTNWGSGVLDYSNGGTDLTCTGTTGLVLPDKVQLRGDGKTKLYFPDLTTGAAITVNATDFTPLVDVWIDGPNWHGAGGTPQAYPGTAASVGLDITGVGLVFRRVKVRNFGANIYAAHSNTYIHKFIDCIIGSAGVGYFNDGEPLSLTENGESIEFIRCTFFNSVQGIRVSGNGLDLKFVGGSMDYLTEFGYNSNSHIDFIGHHQETTGTGTHLWDVQNNSKMHFTASKIIAGKRPSIFKVDQGPTNYGFGKATFDASTWIFHVDATDTSKTRFGVDDVYWPTGQDTVTFYTPFPLRWCAVSAEFYATDGYVVPNDDRVRVSAMNTTTGQITLTAPSHATVNRRVKVSYS